MDLAASEVQPRCSRKGGFQAGAWNQVKCSPRCVPEREVPKLELGKPGFSGSFKIKGFWHNDGRFPFSGRLGGLSRRALPADQWLGWSGAAQRTRNCSPSQAIHFPPRLRVHTLGEIGAATASVALPATSGELPLGACLPTRRIHRLPPRNDGCGTAGELTDRKCSRPKPSRRRAAARKYFQSSAGLLKKK